MLQEAMFEGVVKPKIKTYCKALGLSDKGSRSDLVKRLCEFEPTTEKAKKAIALFVEKLSPDAEPSSTDRSSFTFIPANLQDDSPVETVEKPRKKSKAKPKVHTADDGNKLSTQEAIAAFSPVIAGILENFGAVGFDESPEDYVADMHTRHPGLLEVALA